MCGIVGICNLDAVTIDIRPLTKMMNVIKHRGPDDEGYLLVNTREKSYELAGGEDAPDSVFKGGFPFSPKRRISTVIPQARNFDLVFGHRRLSIIDLSPAGHQPMCNEDGTIWIVYNGEIYNYLELREELLGLGHVFASKSDTEVIIHSYEQWGYDCLSRFNGMWAFAIWDMNACKLFCARDRFGIKPFYYFFDGSVFIFASEIKAILQHPGVQKKVNKAIIYDYMTWSSVDFSSDTFFKGLNQLPPAHYLVINTQKGLAIKQWWELAINSDLGNFSEGNMGDAVDRFLGLMENAIKLRLRSDVPIGTCLSGGLDSSTIFCLANKLILDSNTIDRHLVGDRQKAFSSYVEDERINEKRFVEEILRKTGAEGNFVFPDGRGLWQELSQLVWHQDEPFTGTSIYAQWCVMRLAKGRGVKVLLDGQGGDEVLAGYHRYYGNFLQNLVFKGRILRFLIEAKDASAIIGLRNLSSSASVVSGAVLYGALPMPIKMASRNVAFRFRRKMTHKLLNPGFNKEFTREGLGAFENYLRSATNLQHELNKDMTASLGQLLRYEDRNSMAFSIEARVPFLDYRLVELTFSLPASFKIRHGWTKWLLRQATQGILPEEIRWRRDKIGFATPEAAWLLQNREQIRALFTDNRTAISEFIDTRYLVDNLDRILNGAAQDVWRCINLALWLRVFFDNKLTI